MTTELARGTVVGLPVDPVTMNEAVEIIMDWTDSGGLHVAVGVNAHACNQATDDPALRALMQRADLAYADGHSIVVASRLLGIDVPERVATTDLIFPLARECAARGKRMFFLGGAPGVAGRAAQVLEDMAPGLITLSRDGYSESRDRFAVLDAIRDFGTDVLLVGFGDPMQQVWIAENRDLIEVPAVLTCGGLFDWTSGSRRRAPQLMIRFGLEWLWRLMIEPRRLARRYILGNPVFVVRLVRQLVSLQLGGYRSTT